MCPVMTLEVADATITVQYRGKTIAFCCDTCVKKFRANPERYAGQLVGFTHDGEGESAHEHDSDQTDHDRDSHASAPQSGNEHASDETKMPLLARSTRSSSTSQWRAYRSPWSPCLAGS